VDFFDDVLGGGTGIGAGFFGNDNLRDYRHASKLMRPGGLALTPNTKFNFHVYFTLNTGIPGVSDDSGLIGALVKKVQLPSYKLDTQEYVQYNRKRLVHNRLEYEPVTITLHDDASDIVRTMWFNYYNYYFADSSYQYEHELGQKPFNKAGNAYGYWANRDIYDVEWSQDTWGKHTGSPQGVIKPAFFKDIKIYGMSRGNYQQYTLINPMITNFRHDEYDYSQANGTMQHTMDIKYEAVKYARGKIGSSGSPVNGFADTARYDKTTSPLGGKGDGSILGQDGLASNIGSIGEDLAQGNFFGAFSNAKGLLSTFKNVDLGKAIKNEILSEVKMQGTGVLKEAAKQVFPRVQDSIAGNFNRVATPVQATPIGGRPVSEAELRALKAANNNTPST